jgi:hypothetical protein
MTWDDLREYAEFNRDFVAWARSEAKAGKTVDQAVAEYKIPERYKGYGLSADTNPGQAKANLEKLFNEFKR